MQSELQKFVSHAADLMAEKEPAYQTISNTVGGLRTHSVSISPRTPMSRVMREFENSPELPGVLVFDQEQYLGMLSRRRVYERLSRPYANELYLRHPAARFYSDFQILQNPIASRMRVEDAVRLALGRSGEQIYEPLVVIHDEGKLSLLDMQVLLLAQSQLLVNANRVVGQLYNVSSIISSSLDVNIVLDAILDYLADTIPYDRCVVLFFHKEQVDFAALRGFPQDVDMRQLRKIVLENSIYEAVRHSKQPMCIDDVLSYPEWPHLPQLPPARTWLGIPLVHAGQVSGMLVAIALEPDFYTEAQIQLAQKIAEQAAIALRNAMLFKEVKVFNQQLESAIAERTQSLADAMRKLEAANTSKTEFLKSVSRQLIEPLRKIEGHRQYFLTHAGENLDSFGRDALASVADGIERLHEVVEKIQDVTAIESNEFSLQREALSVGNLFYRLRNRFSASLLEHRLTLYFVNLEYLPDIDGDAHLIFKVFSNLIENAIRHTPVGGKITVKGAHRLAMGAEKARSEVEIVISDTGPGVDPAIQGRIFEKTYHSRSLRATNYSAADSYAGLGLVIVAGIVRAHGGRVWVESRGRDVILNHGSHFYVVLPAAQGSGGSPTTLSSGAAV